MYLVILAWLYIAVLMAVAEAMNHNGTLLGAIVTFFLYGLVPIALVIYLMTTPMRRKARARAEAAAASAARPADATVPAENAAPGTVSAPPDAGGMAPGAAEADRVAAVRKEA
jgi:hypothetical protein